MRRSAAPSQLLYGTAAKKSRFVPPAQVHTGAVLNLNPEPKPEFNSVSKSSSELIPTSAPKPAPDNVLNKVQRSLSEKTKDTPTIARVSVMSKALARVLSAVNQEERKENSLEYLDCPLESEQPPTSPLPQQPELPNSHTATPTVFARVEVRVPIKRCGRDFRR
ncbi:hypothetical protein Baya_1804 [Bagarius yarrelli]|uniref:Uncharacterized protein n=1 Tax=Bagarius yarrelli TaxID=175774 RepID=A0A556TM67_BAGYA|nr:hypothetical protein Baya_1804 [Bagarius yarrelli]